VKVQQVQRNPWVLGAAMLPLLGVPAGIIGAFFVAPLILASLYGAILGVALSSLAWRWNPWPRYEEVEARIDEQQAVIGDQAIPREEIGAAYVYPGEGGSHIVLDRGWTRRNVDLRSDAQTAQKLVTELGLSASQSAATFRTMSPANASMLRQFAVSIVGMLGVVGLVFLAVAIHQALLPVAALAGMAAMMGAMFWPGRVTVGTDGVHVRWLWQSRFIPHSEIASASAGVVGFGNSRRRTLTIQLESNEEVVVAVGSPRWEAGRTDALKARIDQARAAYLRGDTGADVASLAREGRDHLEWIAVLRAALDKGRHRAAAILPERLWSVLEDPSRDPVERAASAVVLGPKLGPKERIRLEETAAAVASPRLRIALESVCEDSEAEALAEAMAELEAEQLEVTSSGITAS